MSTINFDILLNEDWDWSQEVSGEPASKSNSRRLVRVKGIPRVIKSEKAIRYKKEFLSQVSALDSPLEGDVELGVIVWYATRRPDLDVSLIMDLLQEASVITNDRQIKVIRAYHQIDRENPRAFVGLRRISEG